MLVPSTPYCREAVILLIYIRTLNPCTYVTVYPLNTDFEMRLVNITYAIFPVTRRSVKQRLFHNKITNDSVNNKVRKYH